MSWKRSSALVHLYYLVRDGPEGARIGNIRWSSLTMTLLLPPLNLLLSTYLTKSILPPEEESDPPYVEDSPALFKLPMCVFAHVGMGSR